MRQISPKNVPKEYEKLVYTEPKDIAFLENRFLAMGHEKAEHCFSSVVNVINDYTEMSPVIAPIEMAPNEHPNEVMLFHFGIKYNEFGITDIQVVCIYDGGGDTLDLQWVHPNLLEFDTQVLAELINGVFYAVIDETSPSTPMNLAHYCGWRFYFTYNNLKEGRPEIVEANRRRKAFVVRPHMDEDYCYPYDT